jgi:hypothetical protein
MNREFILWLWNVLKWDDRNACADDKAVYLFERKIGKNVYIKLVPTIITAEEYDAAWDYSMNEENKG